MALKRDLRRWSTISPYPGFSIVKTPHNYTCGWSILIDSNSIRKKKSEEVKITRHQDPVEECFDRELKLKIDDIMSKGFFNRIRRPATINLVLIFFGEGLVLRNESCSLVSHTNINIFLTFSFDISCRKNFWLRVPHESFAKCQRSTSIKFWRHFGNQCR